MRVVTLPLLALVLVLVLSLYLAIPSDGQQTTTSGLLLRLRANKLRRPEFCRDSLLRRGEDLPPSVLVVTGRVKEVYLAQQEQEANKALVHVGRVVKGNKQLVGSDIIISGFNASTQSVCPNYVKPNDTLILLLLPNSIGSTLNNQPQQNFYTIYNNNLLPMNLNNLDRVNALANDEPLKRRGPIEDILCEAHYCPYGRCQVLDVNGAQTTTCHCPNSCSPQPVASLCGSDNVTYPNECHLIREGCRLKRPLFVTKESAC